MVEKRFEVDTGALASFGSTADGLATELASVGTSTLAGVDALPADAFGKLGGEVGLAAAFQQAAKAQLDAVAAAAAGLAGFGSAVEKAGGAYTEQQAQAKDDIKRSYQV
ncbi:type VII secretion target [Umezawaea sp. NPDC059074]|uniref:type VII secretion target n=1 Tax=Umezawaea sp. NPDC059074 TaxID=3346716 RepID=UPI0036BF1D80